MIKGLYNINYNEREEFMKNVIKTVAQLQEDNQKVEIQYSTYESNGLINYNAMVIGRIKIE